MLDRCGLPRRVEQRLSSERATCHQIMTAGEVRKLEQEARRAFLNDDDE